MDDFDNSPHAPPPPDPLYAALGGGFAATCKTAHAGHGLPETATLPPLNGDIVRHIDAIAKQLERDERLRAMATRNCTMYAAHAALDGCLRDVAFLIEARDALAQELRFVQAVDIDAVLMGAAANGDAELVQWLARKVTHGSQRAAKTFRRAAADIAEWHGHMDMAGWLETHL